MFMRIRSAATVALMIFAACAICSSELHSPNPAYYATININEGE